MTRIMAQSQEKKPYQGHKKKRSLFPNPHKHPAPPTRNHFHYSRKRENPNDGKEKAIGDDTTRNDF